MNRALIIQTAFLGDVILTTPLVQVLKREHPEMAVDIVVIPSTREVVENHPAVSKVITYDKHGAQKSPWSFISLGRELRKMKYDVIICPHRSLRSALLSRMTNAPVRIGFRNSALPGSFTSTLAWKFGVHEVDRNLSLLEPLGIATHREVPRLFPTQGNREEVDLFIGENRIEKPFAAIAPGTVWRTKQYPVAKMVEVAKQLLERFARIVIVGGPADAETAASFDGIDSRIVSAVGKLSVMSSAELISRASLLVSNDSAPVHIAASFEVPTVAIFGPTAGNFGFYPYGDNSAVVETTGLGCRPCTIHGGARCPIGTFDCMEMITPYYVAATALRISGTRNG
ncbi:MAG TPA: glycosyltransferase family 9 protein [Candidatus Kryptonia bacterium]